MADIFDKEDLASISEEEEENKHIESIRKQNEEEKKLNSEAVTVLSVQNTTGNSQGNKTTTEIVESTIKKKVIESIDEQLKVINNMPPKKPFKNQKIYFIYTRVSDDDYKDSLYDQTEMLRIIAEKKGIWKLVIIQEEKSGYKPGRKSFDEMIKRLKDDYELNEETPESKTYGGILFWKVDRLSRNYGDFGEIEKVFDWGYELISSTETMEATYTGRLLFRILSSFAIYESDKNSARQSLQRIGAFIRKKFKSIRTKKGIFGYKAGKNKNPKINIEEAEVVKFIYKKYLELHVGKKPSKENIYKTIASEIRCSFMNGCFEKFMSKRLISHEKLVEEILEDGKMISYSGMVRYKVGIKDALVAETSIRVSQDNKKENIIISGSLQIGGSIIFNMRMKELVIITNDVIEKVKKTRSLRSQISYKKIFLFTDLVHFRRDSKSTILGIEEYKPNDNFYGYKCSTSKKDASYSLSERKIESVVLHAKVMKYLPVILEDEKRLRKFSDKVNQSGYQIQLKSIDCTEFAYNRLIRRNDKMVKNLEKTRDLCLSSGEEFKKEDEEALEKYLRERTKYSESLTEVTQKKNEVTNNMLRVIDVMRDFNQNRKKLSVKNISDKDRIDRKLLYNLLFRKILVTKLKNNNKLVELEVRPEIVGKLENYLQEQNEVYNGLEEFVID